jgi:hypothetical protein
VKDLTELLCRLAEVERERDAIRSWHDDWKSVAEAAEARCEALTATLRETNDVFRSVQTHIRFSEMGEAGMELYSRTAAALATSEQGEREEAARDEGMPA